jgi:hypothetical protein
MKLRCPYCDKVVEVAESLAGQTTHCGFCQGPFTVPLPPPDQLSAAAPVSPTATEPPARAADPPDLDASLPYPQKEPDAPRTGAAPPSPGIAALRQKLSGVAEMLPGRVIVRFDPSWMEWAPPLGMVFLFLLLFFTWISVDVGTATLLSQGGFGVAFGAVGVVEDLPPFSTHSSGPIFLYLLATFVGFLAAGVLIFLRLAPAAASARFGPWAERLRDHRHTILLATSAGGLLFILFQIFLSFPIESDLAGAEADALLAAALKPRIDGDFQLKPGAAEALMPDFVHRHLAWHLTIVISLLSTLAALLNWMLRRRSLTGRPKLELAWGLET